MEKKLANLRNKTWILLNGEIINDMTAVKMLVPMVLRVK